MLKTSAECYPYRELRLMLTKFEGFFYALTNRFPDNGKMVHTK